MARIRTIKPEFWTDERIVECSPSARLLFLGLLNFSDDYGNTDRSPRQIKMRIFPGDALDPEPLIQELLTQRLLVEYSSNGCQYLNIPNFLKHQKIDKPSARKYPEPPPDLLTRRVLAEGSPQEGKGREGKGIEGNVCKAPSTRATRTVFQKPTLQEVSDYCQERGNNVDPIKFHAFYTSKGWMVGKGPMKDWRACIVTWERKDA